MGTTVDELQEGLVIPCVYMSSVNHVGSFFYQ